MTTKGPPELRRCVARQNKDVPDYVILALESDAGAMNYLVSKSMIKELTRMLKSIAAKPTSARPH
jgi:hypothetical protein